MTFKLLVSVEFNIQSQICSPDVQTIDLEHALNRVKESLEDQLKQLPQPASFDGIIPGWHVTSLRVRVS